MNKILATLSVVLGSSAFAASPASSSSVPYEVLPGDSNEQVSYQVLPSDAPSANRASVQFVIGPGFASLVADDVSDLKSTTGFNAGVLLDIPMGSVMSLGTGLNFVQKGYGMSGRGDIGNGQIVSYDASFKLNYLVIPALLRANFGSSTRFTIGAGPYAGLSVGSSVSAKIDGVEVPGDNFDDSGVSSTDFGLRAIAGLEIPVESSISFLIGGGYDFGLSSIAEKATESVKTRTFMANVGLGVKI